MDLPTATPIALRAAHDGQRADFSIEDPETDVGLGWVGLRLTD